MAMDLEMARDEIEQLRERFREQRLLRDYSRKFAGKQVSTSESNIVKFERGESVPNAILYILIGMQTEKWEAQCERIVNGEPTDNDILLENLRKKYRDEGRDVNFDTSRLSGRALEAAV